MPRDGFAAFPPQSFWALESDFGSARKRHCGICNLHGHLAGSCALQELAAAGMTCNAMDRNEEGQGTPLACSRAVQESEMGASRPTPNDEANNSE
jgi:hypothetical protein